MRYTDCVFLQSSDPFLSILQRNDDVLNRFNLVVKQTTDHNNHVIINVTVEELEEVKSNKCDKILSRGQGVIFCLKPTLFTNL